MRTSSWLRALWLVGSLVLAQSPLGFPAYSTASLANGATNVNGPFAPNTFISIYGQNLATFTGSASFFVSGQAVNVYGSAVRIIVNGQEASYYYQSAGQVNILIPSFMAAGPATVQLLNAGQAGPLVRIPLAEAAPGLFPMEGGYAIATHGNGPVVTPDSPAARGEIVVIYAGGLGETYPALKPYEIPLAAKPLARAHDFQVLLNNVPVDQALIQYVGITPGYAGLYQINLKLPGDAPSNPDIRVGFADAMSPPGRILPLH